MRLWKYIRPYLSSLVRFFRISYIEATQQKLGSRIGVLWVPLSTLIFSVMLAVVFRQSDTMSLVDFFFYVLAGYTLWGFISTSVVGSIDVIQNRYDFAIHNNLSLPGLFGKLLMDRLFEYCLNLAMLLGLLLVLSPSNFGRAFILFLPFLALVLTTSLGTAYLVNLATVFFPDMKALIRVGMRFMFFVSPIFWRAAEASSGPRAFLVQYNPIAYYLTLQRQVLGIEPLDARTWLVAAIFSTLICVVGWLAYYHSQHFVRNLR